MSVCTNNLHFDFLYYLFKLFPFKQLHIIEPVKMERMRQVMEVKVNTFHVKIWKNYIPNFYLMSLARKALLK